MYLNSLLDVAIALNLENFAEKYHISSGPEWSITFEKIEE
ncbi:MAG: hypothetical protein ACK5MJ_05285 [Alphaproteobacteria bacterium]